MPEEYKGRKIVLCLLAMLLAAAMLWFGKIGEKAFEAIVTFVVGAYVLGNVGQKGLEWWLGASATTTPAKAP